VPKPDPHPMTTIEVGHCYIFESVTSNLWVGRVVSIDGPHSVTLEDCSWVSETGRLHQFMRAGRADGMEVEPVGVRGVHWASWGPWPFALFKEAI
jgi:hypothetical protein